jgi:hypothetical protein
MGDHTIGMELDAMVVEQQIGQLFAVGFPGATAFAQSGHLIHLGEFDRYIEIVGGFLSAVAV